MRNDYDVVLTRKDGSVRHFHIYGTPAPKGGDVITLPVEGQVIKARINESPLGSDVVQSVGRAEVFEI
jgi:hypothetical protein